MSPADRDVLVRKQRHIVTCLDALKPLAGCTLDQYRADDLRRKGAEKYIIEIAGAAIDLNYHLLVASGKPAPTDYRDSFFRLADAGILSRRDAEHLAALAGLRNRLIHAYEQIDDGKVQEALSHLPALMGRYLQALTLAFD